MYSVVMEVFRPTILLFLVIFLILLRQWRASIELGRTPILALSIDVGACTVALDEDKDASREANRGAISRWVVPVWRKIENLFGDSEAQK